MHAVSFEDNHSCLPQAQFHDTPTLPLQTFLYQAQSGGACHVLLMDLCMSWAKLDIPAACCRTQACLSCMAQAQLHIMLVLSLQTPMDLGTIWKKLGRNQYPSPVAVMEMVQLVWRNCYTFNEPDSDVHKLCQELEVHVNKIWEDAGLPMPPQKQQPQRQAQQQQQEQVPQQQQVVQQQQRQQQQAAMVSAGTWRALAHLD